MLPSSYGSYLGRLSLYALRILHFFGNQLVSLITQRNLQVVTRLLPVVVVVVVVVSAWQKTNIKSLVSKESTQLD